MKSNTSDKCYVYFDIYVEPTLAELCNEKTFSNCIKENVYTADGENGLYYHDGTGTYTNASEEAGDNSYRYSGTNPNNYVCFGSDETTCPNDNLYRIIGLFDDDEDGTYNIKMIKYDYTTSEMLGTDGDYYSFTTMTSSYYKGNMNVIAKYSWNNSTGNYDWNESELNKINLNTNYWDSLGSKWQDMITSAIWIVGGHRSSKIYYDVITKETYQNEIVQPARSTTYTSKIALMYVSDYGYAASPENWQTSLSDYDNDTNRNNNWLFMGITEWTITPIMLSSNYLCNLVDNGSIEEDESYLGYAARPVFYLKSNVKIAGGSGTSSDPYRISLN